MRTLFAFVFCCIAASVSAQVFPASPKFGNAYSLKAGMRDSVQPKKWFVTRYAGFSSGISFFNGGHATVFSVPVGVQLNRRLSNNWYAFAAASAAPSYVNFSGAFRAPYTKGFQNNAGYSNSRVDIFSRAEVGLMYVNDQKTFSISGSIGVGQGTYPWLPANQAGLRQYNPVFPR